MRRIAIALAGAAVLLTGCANMLDGEVTSKTVEPGYTTVIPIVSSVSCGKGCTSTTTTMIPVYIPPCYKITVDGATDEATGSTCLSGEEEWNTYEVGDSYTGEDVDPEDPERAKEL